MPKKSKNKNLLVVGGVIAAAAILYLVSSYAGLLSTKTFFGKDRAVATSLECSISEKNELEAKLTVSGSLDNSLALPEGSVLGSQNIEWNIPTSLGSISSPTSISVTDEDGVARKTFSPSDTSSSEDIVAVYKGDRIQVDTIEGDDVHRVIVIYGPSSCKISRAGN